MKNDHSTVRQEGARERILGVAESMILQNGFSGTSIGDILERASITKGGFFYHFSDKRQLARALVERYLEQDTDIFNSLFVEADQKHSDPLQQLLHFLELFAGMMDSLEALHPGCLVASFTYESQQVDPETTMLIRQGILQWRKLILLRLEKISERYCKEKNVDLVALADMFTSVVEGGIILSRVLHSNQHLSGQIMQYRQYLQLLFR